MNIRHLPYQIDPDTNRLHLYENLWKQVGLELLLKQQGATGKTVLDYGSGRGEAVRLFNQAGFQTTGADLDPTCVQLSAQHGTAVLLESADPVLQFGPKSFDVVVCFHVLEHVASPVELLRCFRQLAREYVLVAVPNLRQLVHLRKSPSLACVNAGHLQGWDHQHLLNLAERHCQLQLVEWGFDTTLLPVLSQLATRIGGQRLAIRLETGLFRRWFPYHGHSVIGLFRVG